MENLRGCCIAASDLHRKNTTERSRRIGISELDETHTCLPASGTGACGSSRDCDLEWLQRIDH